MSCRGGFRAAGREIGYLNSTPSSPRFWGCPRAEAKRRPAKLLRRLVGAGRFELPTPCSRSKCATRLRYAPPDRSSPLMDDRRASSGSRGEAGFIATMRSRRKQPLQGTCKFLAPLFTGQPRAQLPWDCRLPRHRLYGWPATACATSFACEFGDCRRNARGDGA